MSASGFTERGTFTPDNLFAGEFPCVQRIEKITGDTPLPRGAVLGRVTDSGVYRLSEKDATDGSAIPVAILAEPIDATTQGVTAVVYHSGEFNTAALLYGTGHSAHTVWESTRTEGNNTLFLRHNQEA